MATTTRILDANVSGTVYTVNANNIFEALDTCHAGATAPTNEVANGKLWLDTSTAPDTLKIYSDGVWNAVYTGRNVAADGTKLDGIEAGATADQTAAQLLTAIKTVDGTGSGLDADLLDGQQATAFATSAQGALASSAVQPGSSPSFNVVTANNYLGDGSSLTGLSNPVKAWVNFNGTGTVAIRASLNVSSITDNGVGDYTVNFATALSTSDYALAGMCQNVSVNNNTGLMTLASTSRIADPITKTTTQCRVKVGQSNTTDFLDMNNISATFFA